MQLRPALPCHAHKQRAKSHGTSNMPNIQEQNETYAKVTHTEAQQSCTLANKMKKKSAYGICSTAFLQADSNDKINL